MARNPRAAKGTKARVEAPPERLPKHVRMGVDREDTPMWRLTLLDLEGDWGWGNVTPRDLVRIVEFLQQMERLAWREIRSQITGGRNRGPKHKFIPIAALEKPARDRVVALELDEYTESWFRFRTGWDERLWGVIVGRVFYPVWWDPHHDVCGNNDQN